MKGGNANAEYTASQATVPLEAQGGLHFLLVQTSQEPPAWVLCYPPDIGIWQVDLA